MKRLMILSLIVGSLSGVAFAECVEKTDAQGVYIDCSASDSPSTIMVTKTKEIGDIDKLKREKTRRIKRLSRQRSKLLDSLQAEINDKQGLIDLMEANEVDRMLLPGDLNYAMAILVDPTPADDDSLMAGAE